MADLSASEARFPARELEIRRQCARDPEFRRVCEDYEVAVKALRHWECSEGHADREAEYRQLVDEIANEIAACLDAASRSFIENGTEHPDSHCAFPKRGGL